MSVGGRTNFERGRDAIAWELRNRRVELETLLAEARKDLQWRSDPGDQDVARGKIEALSEALTNWPKVRGSPP